MGNGVTNKNVYNRNRWLFGSDTIKYELSDLISINLDELINIYIEMLVINGLETFDNKLTNFDIMRLLIKDGKLGLIYDEKENKAYITEIELTEDYLLNENYHFKKCFIRSQFLINKYNRTEYTIDEDIFLIRNNKYMTSDFPRFYEASLQLAQSDITIEDIVFKMRLTSFFQADSPEGNNALKQMFNDVYNGSKIYSICEDTLTNDNSIKQFQLENKSPKDVLEFKNFIRSYALISMSLNANYNMKRESLGENETAVQYDSLSPYIDNRLEAITEDLNKFNKATGKNLKVNLDSAWKQFIQQMEQSLENNELLNNDKVLNDAPGENKTEAKEGDTHEVDSK